MPVRRSATLILVALLLAGCNGGVSPTTPIVDNTTPRLVSPGRPAPPLEGKDSEDHSFDLKAYHGKVVLLTFWATDCPPCRAFHRHERSLANHFKDKPFALLGVNTDRDPETCRHTQIDEKMSWPSLIDDGTALLDWGVSGTPTIFLIDAKGDVRFTSGGAPDEKDLRRLIDELLGEIK